MDPSNLRAGDADRERVAARLKTALDEGRLNLHEYDDRLREAYGARTYAELNALLSDLPGTGEVVPATPGVPVPGPDGRYPAATRQWVAHHWGPWAGPVLICTAIWAVSSAASGGWAFFWPIWVAVPWGLMLLGRTARGLAAGEPQQWAARRARRAAEREIRHNRRARGALTE